MYISRFYFCFCSRSHSPSPTLIPTPTSQDQRRQLVVSHGRYVDEVTRDFEQRLEDDRDGKKGYHYWVENNKLVLGLTLMLHFDLVLE